jgi:hypothetical protein
VAAPAPPPARKPPVQRVAPPAPDMAAFTQEDHMELFREMKADDRELRRTNIEVEDVDLGDLLEDLSTTMAALRRLKAA